jgi:L-ribulose-5-phosphate 3-epimerase
MNPIPNRRDVLKAGGAAATAAALAWTALRPAALSAADPGGDKPPKGSSPGPASADASATRSPGARRPFKKAVMYGMIGEGKTVLDKFQVLKDCGFDGVEMDSPTDLKRDDIKRAAEETGILIEGEVDSAHWRQTLTHSDPKMREAGVRALETALRDCAFLGGTSVLLVPGVVDQSVPYDVAYQRSQENIRRVIPLARELGVKIAVENVWNHFLLSPLEAARFIDEFEAPDVMRWHFDIGNIIAFGWPEQWIRILGKRIVKLHFKEYSRTKRDKEGLGKGFNVELLEGDNDWPAIMKALDEVGYNTWACAEMGGGNRQRLKTIAEKMDRILAM